MKLTDEIKKQIDNFFNSISAEELYRLSVEEYGFEEVPTEPDDNNEIKKYVEEHIDEIYKEMLEAGVEFEDIEVTETNKTDNSLPELKINSDKQ